MAPRARTSQTTSTPSPTIPLKKAYLYFVFPSGTSIEDSSIQKVKQAIQNSTLDELNLIVHSSGGDLYSAVKIIRILRNKFKNIKGIVPFRAMSAATLMLLGTSEIYMSEESQLGPLDLPVEHPVDGSTISSLDLVNTLNQTASSAWLIAEDTYEELRDLRTGEKIGKVAAMKMALDMAIEIVKPITNKIDPYQRQKAFRKLKIGQLYAYDLLKTGMFKNTVTKANLTALKFVHSFPDHSYAIFKEEARDTLKLDIKDSTGYTDWSTVCISVEKYKDESTPTILYEEK